jgi:hypothetical protein
MSKKTATPNHTPGNVSKDDKTADASVGDLNEAANVGADTKNRRAKNNPHEPNRAPLKEGEHPGKDFRFSVENTPAGDLNQDPRTPYPTGNPPDPYEVLREVRGPAEENDDGTV